MTESERLGVRKLKPKTLALRTCSALCIAMFGFAFVAAPKSCEWGNEAYFWMGVVCLVALFVVPLALRAGRTMLWSLGMAVGFVAVGAVVWIAGLFAANFRIICRLF